MGRDSGAGAPVKQRGRRGMFTASDRVFHRDSCQLCVCVTVVFAAAPAPFNCQSDGVLVVVLYERTAHVHVGSRVVHLRGNCPSEEDESQGPSLSPLRLRDCFFKRSHAETHGTRGRNFSRGSK